MALFVLEKTRVIKKILEKMLHGEKNVKESKKPNEDHIYPFNHYLKLHHLIKVCNQTILDTDKKS
jgi:hypothetical protein